MEMFVTVEMAHGRFAIRPYIRWDGRGAGHDDPAPLCSEEIVL
jgi:hypothetical protein